ncbi:MAG TPA: polymer-forming cytoskeletal protein [Gemmatimonadaceae bacterium]|nr:polymer-forming cytoskeletal protein [Gemmatimonadaceae bacterium]
MAIFKEEKQQDSKSGPVGEGALSIIAAGMTVNGDIDSTGVVKVEGRVEGAIRSARQVLVGRQGVVRGDIETREAVIGGTVEGTITASERVEIQATASIQGDIVTRSIVIAEGGKINGSVRMEEGRTASRPAPSAEPAISLAK